MIRIKRKRYLVNRGVQFRYMGLVVVPLIILLSGLYYLIYYSVFSEMLIPEAVTATLLPAMRKVNVVAVLAIPAILFVILKMALVYSNRIVGPIPRIERELDKAIARSDYSIRLRARSRDELKGFINRVNRLLETIEALKR